MGQTSLGGLRINYDDLSQGEPTLLFLPGWCTSRNLWGNLVQRCARRRRTLALDWRGHGESESPTSDFGNRELMEDALSVIEASGANQLVPVAFADAGWVAIELRRKLGKRIARLVLLDWIVCEAPLRYLEALKRMQSPDHWRQTVDQMISRWLQGLETPALTRFVREEIRAHAFLMWARAAREISAAYAKFGSPLKELSLLEPPTLVFHLYSQPQDPQHSTAQLLFARANTWFQAHTLNAKSHFPMFEAPDEMAREIELSVR